MIVTANDILNKVSYITGIGIKDINSNSRLQAVSNARKLFWICLRMNGYNTEGIALIAKRDHSTIAKLTRDSYEKNKALAEQILVSLGAEIFEMMPKIQEFSKLPRSERGKYCKLSNNMKLLVIPENIPERKKRKIVVKKIPDYKNYTIKTVWRIADDD